MAAPDPSPLIAYAAVVRADGVTLAAWSAPGAPVPAAVATDVAASLDLSSPGTASYSSHGWLWTVRTGDDGVAVLAASPATAPRTAVSSFLATVKAAVDDARLDTSPTAAPYR